MSADNIIRLGGMQLAMLPILARMLGPHGYGLASFSMPDFTGIARQRKRNVGRGRPRRPGVSHDPV
jgi:hypothetical protein